MRLLGSGIKQVKAFFLSGYEKFYIFLLLTHYELYCLIITAGNIWNDSVQTGDFELYLAVMRSH
jgi:hypothetical protein